LLPTFAFGVSYNGVDSIITDTDRASSSNRRMSASAVALTETVSGNDVTVTTVNASAAVIAASWV
jgi:hypothetical protein